MSRSKREYRTGSRENYNNFKIVNPKIDITYQQYLGILNKFSENIVDHILKTGEVVKLPYGLGNISVNKKKSKMYKTYNGIKYINLPIDWVKTKEKGKHIYNLNSHSDGYKYYWIWLCKKRVYQGRIWHMKATRVVSRKLATAIKSGIDVYSTYKV